MFFKGFFNRLVALEQRVQNLETAERVRQYDRTGRPCPLAVAESAYAKVDQLAAALGYTYENATVCPAKFVRKGGPENPQ